MRALLPVLILTCCIWWLFRCEPMHTSSWIGKPEPYDPPMTYGSTPRYTGDAAKGKQLFMDNCARCHSPALEKDLTGPALAGMMRRVPSREWLYEWIPNSAKMIQKGDPYALAIYEEWEGASMDPMPHLTREDMDAMIEWINAYSSYVY